MISPLLMPLVTVAVAIGILAPPLAIKSHPVIAPAPWGCDFGCTANVWGEDDPAVKHVEKFTVQTGRCTASSKQPCYEDIPCKMDVSFGIEAPRGRKFRIGRRDGTNDLVKDEIFRFETTGCGTYKGTDGNLAISIDGRTVTIGCYCAKCVGFGH